MSFAKAPPYFGTPQNLLFGKFLIQFSIAFFVVKYLKISIGRSLPIVYGLTFSYRIFQISVFFDFSCIFDRIGIWSSYWRSCLGRKLYIWIQHYTQPSYKRTSHFRYLFDTIDLLEINLSRSWILGGYQSYIQVTTIALVYRIDLEGLLKPLPWFSSKNFESTIVMFYTLHHT